MDRKELIDALKSLTEAELTTLFYEAYSGRKTQVGSDADDVYVVRNAGIVDGDPRADVYISALSASGSDALGALSQLGFCERCQINIQCVSKNAVCPICGRHTDCT